MNIVDYGLRYLRFVWRGMMYAGPRYQMMWSQSTSRVSRMYQKQSSRSLRITVMSRRYSMSNSYSQVRIVILQNKSIVPVAVHQGHQNPGDPVLVACNYILFDGRTCYGWESRESLSEKPRLASQNLFNIHCFVKFLYHIKILR